MPAGNRWQLIVVIATTQLSGATGAWRSLRIDLLTSSNPTPHCLGCVSGLRIETEFRVRGMFVHEVNQFLEQDEVGWNHADTRSNHDAVKLLLFELGQNDRFRSLAKIGQANARVVANGLQTFLVGGQSRITLAAFRPGKAAKSGWEKSISAGFKPTIITFFLAVALGFCVVD